jgi:hypothetical protein
VREPRETIGHHGPLRDSRRNVHCPYRYIILALSGPLWGVTLPGPILLGCGPDQVLCGQRPFSHYGGARVGDNRGIELGTGRCQILFPEDPRYPCVPASLREKPWIPAPDQVEGRLCAGMTNFKSVSICVNPCQRMVVSCWLMVVGLKSVSGRVNPRRRSSWIWLCGGRKSLPQKG